MKLATLRIDGTTAAVRVDDTSATLIDGYPDLSALLAAPDWESLAQNASGPTVSLDGADYAPVVPRPGKIVCVGLNYATHIKEMGRDLPEYPTLFAKFTDALIGAHDDIHRPAETDQFDWEAELALVVGRPVRRADEAEAAAAIAGFTVLNDITCRDWQFRTREWLQGKNWDSTTPLGPYLVTSDEVGGSRPALDIRCEVNGQLMQQDNTGDLLFDPVDLVRYVSAMIRLNPGDIIATGTPGGVGHARKPQVFLRAGDTVVTEIAGVGRLENHVITEGPS